MTAPTPDDLARIEELAEKATPGPWWGGGDRGRQGGAKPMGLVGRLDDRGTGNAIAVLAGVGMDRVADAEFIAAARTAVPDLVAGVRSLQARITELEAVIAEAPHGQKCDWWHAIPCDCWKSRYRAGAEQ